MGIFKYKSILARDTNALDRVLLANDRVHRISLVMSWSNDRKLI
jgi:hypothetical protein